MKILRKYFSNKEQKRLRRELDIKLGRDAGNLKTDKIGLQDDELVRNITSRAKLMDDKDIIEGLKKTNNLSYRKKHGLKTRKGTKKGLWGISTDDSTHVSVPEEIVRRGRKSSRDLGSKHGNLHERISNRSRGEVISQWPSKENFGRDNAWSDNYGKYKKTLPNNFLNTAEGKKQTAVKESIKKHEKIAAELRKKKVNGEKLKKATAIGLGSAAIIGGAAYGIKKAIDKKNKKSSEKKD